MGDQKNQDSQNPGQGSEQGRKDDQLRRDQNERAGQNPQDKHERDRSSNPSEPREKQDPQFDPSHIQKE
jgi:hypothetical protein